MIKFYQSTDTLILIDNLWYIGITYNDERIEKIE